MSDNKTNWEEHYGDTFCVYPWLSLMVNTSGSIDFCCIAKPSVLRDQDGKILDISTTTLKEAWNSDAMKDLRLGMIQGEQISSCKHCYLQEEVGKKSFRQMHNEEWERRIGADAIHERVKASYDNDMGLPDHDPVYLDLRLGNLCNLSCRMCNSFNSSTIAKENKQLEELEPEYKKIQEKTYGKTPDWVYSKEYRDKFDADVFWKDIYAWLPDLRKVYMTGGEPTMIKNNMDFLDFAADNGHAKHITVFMNTNCTNANPKFLNSISKYESVDINASLDGVGNVNEFIRGTKSWDIILRNYRAMLDKPNVNSNITPVLQIYNLNRIHEVLYLAAELTDEYYPNHDWKTIGVDILINTHPNYLDIRNLTVEQRQPALKRLQEFSVTCKYLYEKNWLVKNSVDGIISYLQQPQLENWHENLTEFVTLTQVWDRKRNTNFSIIDDELYQSIKEML
jgi:MoaA/NifB/PqqE/SkfB family radical SAM enzyme